MYIQIGELSIPTYGLMIILGVISANLLAIPIIKKYGLDGNDFIIIEAYTFFGAFLGAKLLYLWVSRGDIEWNRILDNDYFNQIMRGGFVFYGGLIGGIITAFLGGNIHHINTKLYVRKMIFLIPWIHCFGRIGCHLAGCCYGRPYDGVLSVVYPQGGLAPAGIGLFPVQLVEAGFLFVIAASIFLLQIFRNMHDTVELYIISYSCLRFILEYLRDDDARGSFLLFSTSQWISIFLVLGVFVYIMGRWWRRGDVEGK